MCIIGRKDSILLNTFTVMHIIFNFFSFLRYGYELNYRINCIESHAHEFSQELKCHYQRRLLYCLFNIFFSQSLITMLKQSLNSLFYKSNHQQINGQISYLSHFLSPFMILTVKAKWARIFFSLDPSEIINCILLINEVSGV